MLALHFSLAVLSLWLLPTSPAPGSNLNQALLAAAAQGDLPTVKALLTKGADMNAVNDQRQTPLLRAAEREQTAVVRLLVEKGANVNAQDADGNTALMVSSEQAFDSSACAILKVLLEHGADPNLGNQVGETPIWNTVIDGQSQAFDLLLARGAQVNRANTAGLTLLMQGPHWAMSAVKARKLLAQGANVNAVDAEGQTPLIHAVLGADNELVPVYLKAGARVNARDQSGRTALDYALDYQRRPPMLQQLKRAGGIAARHTSTHLNRNARLADAVNAGNLNQVRALLTQGANPNSADEGVPLLLRAANNDDLGIVQALARKGANLRANTADGDTALTFSLGRGKTAVAAYLLARGADINARNLHGQTTLWIRCATLREEPNFIRFLLQHGAEVNAASDTGDTPLHIAASFDRLRSAALLVAHSAEVNQRNNDGDTALMIAVRRSYADVVKLLLDHKADAAAKTRSGTPTLVLAAQQGDAGIVQAILDHQADPNASDVQGMTALQHAARLGRLDVARLLLDHGAALDQPGGPLQQTPLIVAAANGQLEAVRLLLEHSPQVSRKDAEGKTALEYAREADSRPMVELLTKAGAKE